MKIRKIPQSAIRNPHSVLAYRLAFGLLLAAHAWQCLRCFPSPGAILDDRPIIGVDHALHLYHGFLGARFLGEHGTNWGYDPFFMAGYPKTPLHDPSSGLAELSLFLIGCSYDPAAYKIGLIVTMLTTPLLFAAGARLLGLSPSSILAGSTLFLWYYWTGFPRVLLESGLYSFLWACAWMTMILGLITAWHRSPTLTRWLALTAGTSLGLFVHPTLSIMLAGPLAVFYVSIARKHSFRWHFALWSAVLVVLLTNSFWIVGMFRFWHLRKVSYVFLAAPLDEPLFFLTFYSSRPLALFSILLGLLALLRWCFSGRRDLLATLGVSMAVLFGLTFFGSLFTITRSLEPLRFQVPLHLCACLAGGELFIFLIDAIRFDSFSKILRTGILLLFSAGVCVWLTWAGVFRQSYHAIVHSRPFSIGLRPPMLELVRWIDENTDDSSRIMLEDQLRLREATEAESLHWTCLLPILTRRQFIGGQYQVAPLLHHHAAFGDFHLAGRPIGEFTDIELSEFLVRYNVGWVICWSQSSQAVFEGLPQAQLRAILPRYTSRPNENEYFVYQIETPSSFFAEGTGRVVRVDLNRIELADLVPEHGRIVVRYHWLDTFAATPKVLLEPARAGDDPIGFLGIRTNHSIDRLVIENDY